MEHVVKHPTPPFRSASQSLEVHQVPAATDNLVWLLVCRQTRACAVVDGPSAHEALAYARAHDLEIGTILNTHTHGDHVGINTDLMQRGQLGQMQVIGPKGAQDEVPGITRAVTHGETVQVGNVQGRVILTEGHIRGHVCYLFEDVLFCGDALFTGGCGRVFTGDFVATYQGLARLAELDPRTRVCCAHEYTEDNLRFALSVEPGNVALAERALRVHALRAQGGCAVPSTLGEELDTNPMLRWHSAELIGQVQAQAKDADLKLSHRRADRHA